MKKLAVGIGTVLVVSSIATAEEYFVSPLAHFVLDKAGCSCKSVSKFPGYAICHVHEHDVQKTQDGFVAVKCRGGTIKIHPSNIAQVPHSH